MNKIRSELLMILLVIAVSSHCFLLIKHKKLYVDEHWHCAQISSFIHGNYNLNKGITTFPGYHFVIAKIAKLLCLFSVPYISLRLISFSIGIPSVIVFYLISKMIDCQTSGIKTLQFFFFPILFLFFFLIYTDVLSILLVLSAFYLLIKNKYKAAWVIGVASMLVRQSNIVWIVFFALYIYREEFSSKLNSKNLKSYLKQTWFYWIVPIIFGTLVAINKGMVTGDRASHPLGLYSGNIFFCLFLFFLLFLPLNAVNFKKALEYVKKNKKVTFIAGLLLFLAYLLTFKADHPYNADPWFLRNRVLTTFTSSVLLKIILFIPIAYSVLSLCVTKLKRRSYYLLYPLTFLYLVPSWLIEQRYYLIPFTLFILFKAKTSDKVERLTLIMYIALSAIFFYGVLNRIFFL